VEKSGEYILFKNIARQMNQFAMLLVVQRVQQSRPLRDLTILFAKKNKECNENVKVAAGCGII